MSRFFWGGETPPGLTGAGGAVTGSTVVYKTADEVVNNSSVLQGDNHLTASFTTGKKYYFEVLLHAIDATATGIGGIKVAMGGTAILANMVALAEITGPTVGVSATSRLTALGQVVSEEANAEDKPVVKILGSVEVTTGGTFLVQWAQSSANIGDLTVLRGSTLLYQEAL